MADRIKILREFRRVLWVCPSCGQEDYEDFNVSGGNEYIHTCSNCSNKFNQSAGAMKEYNGTLSYTQEAYDELTEQEIEDAKDAQFSKWIYNIQHPLPYVEPTKEELERQKADLERQVAEVQTQIDTKEAEIGD